MKICKRRPIYRMEEQYFVICYEYYCNGGLSGHGNFKLAVKNHSSIKFTDVTIDYGFVMSKILKGLEDPKSVIIFKGAYEISKEFYEGESE